MTRGRERMPGTGPEVPSRSRGSIGRVGRKLLERHGTLTPGGGAGPGPSRLPRGKASRLTPIHPSRTGPNQMEKSPGTEGAKATYPHRPETPQGPASGTRYPDSWPAPFRYRVPGRGGSEPSTERGRGRRGGGSASRSWGASSPWRISRRIGRSGWSPSHHRGYRIVPAPAAAGIAALQMATGCWNAYDLDRRWEHNYGALPATSSPESEEAGLRRPGVPTWPTPDHMQGEPGASSSRRSTWKGRRALIDGKQDLRADGAGLVHSTDSETIYLSIADGGGEHGPSSSTACSGNFGSGW